MFGEIHLLKKILETPVVLNTLQSPYGNDQGSQLWHVLCNGKEKLWTCGDNVIISEINRSGHQDSFQKLLNLQLMFVHKQLT